MHPYSRNVWVLLQRRHVERSFVIAAVCALLLIARAGGEPPTNAGYTAINESGAGGHTSVDDNRGPTVKLSYLNEAHTKNPISAFMYFIPLISLTDVDRQTSANNDEVVSMISYERRIGAESFYVACEFELRGKGFHKNSFDPAGVIASRTEELKGNELLTTAMDYIKFEGEGFGRIEVEGTIHDSTETVTEVNLQFNARGGKSPVTIGLYDIEPKDGQYEYANRSNERVARVNTLSFSTGDMTPRMGVSLASITKAEAPDGYIARIKGTIANPFIKPPKIDKLGNETMLNFGYAILKQQPEFTFPIALNLKEDRKVATLPLEP